MGPGPPQDKYMEALCSLKNIFYVHHWIATPEIPPNLVNVIQKVVHQSE